MTRAEFLRRWEAHPEIKNAELVGGIVYMPSQVSLEHGLAEVERVTAAACAGEVRPLGNWSPAQVLWHIGKLIEHSFDGFSWRYRRGPQWITRPFRFLAWRWLIRLAFRSGFKNPPEAAVLEPPAARSLEDAAAYLRRQIQRIRCENG